MKTAIRALFMLVLHSCCSHVFAASNQGWEVNTWEEPFDYQSPTITTNYAPAEKASRTWHLCIAYPHLKDAYWLSVNYGMVEEAKRLGVKFTLVEAGGYPNVARQRQQIQECAENGADGLIIGAVSFELLEDTLTKIADKMPVLATVNDVSDKGITAKTGVSWLEMGKIAGQYISNRHPIGEPPVRVAWFPGPKGAGWVKFIEQGFKEGIDKGSIDVVVTKWGDTGKEIQRTLVQEALEAHKNIDYIVGNALMAEAAISVLRQMSLEHKTKIVSTYFTPAVYRGIRRSRILAAPTDAPVLQGRLSINQAVRVLEKRHYFKHLGPKIKLVSQSNFRQIPMDDSLAPSTFLPTFVVD